MVVCVNSFTVNILEPQHLFIKGQSSFNFLIQSHPKRHPYFVGGQRFSLWCPGFLMLWLNRRDSWLHLRWGNILRLTIRKAGLFHGCFTDFTPVVVTCLACSIQVVGLSGLLNLSCLSFWLRSASLDDVSFHVTVQNSTTLKRYSCGMCPLPVNL